VSRGASVDRANAGGSGGVLGGGALKDRELQDILDILRDSRRLQYDIAAARRQDAPQELPRPALGITISQRLRPLPRCGVPASAEECALARSLPLVTCMHACIQSSWQRVKVVY
jgi:hypothetical protein